MKKKIITSILTVFCIVFCVFSFVGCKQSHEHDFTVKTIEPTCTTQGYVALTCDCGYTQYADYKQAKGHNYINGVCSICGVTDGTVIDPPDKPTDVDAEGLNLNKQYLILNAGQSETLVVSFTPAGSSSSVVWSSTSPFVATVENGIVTAVGAGTAIVTATLPNGEYKVCEVAVHDKTALGIEFAKVEGGYEVAYYRGNGTEIEISAKYNGEPVIGIGERAFENCKTLVKTVIPDSITYIGKNAFSGCSGIIEVKVPETITQIGENAFENCGSLSALYWNAIDCECKKSIGLSTTVLKNLVFGSNVVAVPNYLLSGVSTVESIVIPDGITTICERAFFGCSSLTSVTIPDSVTSIWSEAFGNCSGLTSVAIGNGVTYIGNNAFSGCDGVTTITVPSTAVSYFEKINLQTVTITGGESIGERAFSGCGSLSSITICNSVTSIGNYAFEKCNSLTNITIPDSVINVGNYAFSECSGLTSVTIGNGVTSIGNYAFDECVSLTSVTIPDSVTSIGRYAFDNCSGLTSVTIGNGVTYIGERAFFGCSGLTSVTIPDSVTSIWSEAFGNCSGLTSVTVSKNITAIGGRVFGGCSNLTDATIPAMAITCFDKTSLQTVVISGGDRIYGHDFENFVSLTSVTIGNSVKIIGEYAFSGCGNLSSVKIPNSVTYIGNNAFAGCDKLTIYCESSSSREHDWDNGWNPDNRPVTWDYSDEQHM